MLYVGAHKGSETDGYVSSSPSFNEEYSTRPNDFTRTIVASGPAADMFVFESALLKCADAAKSDSFYNKNNNDGKFVCLGHTDKTKLKMSETWKNKGEWNCDNKKAIKAWCGQKHTHEAKARMSEAGKKHSATRSDRMTKNNPMKDPAAIQKMLETRRKNKMERLNGRAN
jgi:hypothetical protein